MWLREYLQRRRTETIRLEKVEFSWLGVKGSWVADREQQQAAWEMYIELVTRVALQPVAPGEGLISEALASLYSLFGETRRILKAHGPTVARSLSPDSISFGSIAIAVLNHCVRPVLAKWHPLLLTHEAKRPADRSAREHERAWYDHDACRAAIDDLATKLGNYATLLARAAGVAPIH